MHEVLTIDSPEVILSIILQCLLYSGSSLQSEGLHGDEAIQNLARPLSPTPDYCFEQYNKLSLMKRGSGPECQLARIINPEPYFPGIVEETATIGKMATPCQIFI